MKQLSVVIPTLWKVPDITLRSLSLLNESMYVKEIILIDNTPNPPNLNLNKVRHIKEYRNTYCYKPLNKGHRLSQSDYLCMANDDIIIGDKTHQTALKWLTGDIGMIGLSGFNESYKYNPQRETKIKVVRCREYAYACLFYIHKKNWIDIPDDLKIWYGDDYQFNKINKPHYKIVNPEVKGYVSASNSNTVFDEIIKQDKINYLNHINL